jgi:hypothetical protein
LIRLGLGERVFVLIMASLSTIAKDAALLESIDMSSTMDLHRSNLTRMQVDELLQECHLDLTQAKWAPDAQQYLQTLSAHIKQLAPFQDELIDRADKIVKVKLDQQQLSKELTVEPMGCTKTPLAWTKPSGNAQVLPTFQLMVQLPAKMFSSKDYLNYRYFDVSFGESCFWGRRKTHPLTVYHFLSLN